MRFNAYKYYINKYKNLGFYLAFIYIFSHFAILLLLKIIKWKHI